MYLPLHPELHSQKNPFSWSSHSSAFSLHGLDEHMIIFVLVLPSAAFKIDFEIAVDDDLCTANTIPIVMEVIIRNMIEIIMARCMNFKLLNCCQHDDLFMTGFI